MDGVYYYARNSYEFWGYSIGIDFERIILIKNTPPKLLEDFIRGESWRAHAVVMSGNKDCYQPAEQSYQLIRQCL